MELTREILQRMPKVLLHDHLDGGLRPGTVIELAKEYGVSALGNKHGPSNVAGVLCAL